MKPRKNPAALDAARAWGPHGELAYELQEAVRDALLEGFRSQTSNAAQLKQLEGILEQRSKDRDFVMSSYSTAGRDFYARLPKKRGLTPGRWDLVPSPYSVFVLWSEIDDPELLMIFALKPLREHWTREGFDWFWDTVLPPKDGRSSAFEISMGPAAWHWKQRLEAAKDADLRPSTYDTTDLNDSYYPLLQNAARAIAEGKNLLIVGSTSLDTIAHYQLVPRLATLLPTASRWNPEIVTLGTGTPSAYAERARDGVLEISDMNRITQRALKEIKERIDRERRATRPQLPRLIVAVTTTARRTYDEKKMEILGDYVTLDVAALKPRSGDIEYNSAWFRSMYTNVLEPINDMGQTAQELMGEWGLGGRPRDNPGEVAEHESVSISLGRRQAAFIAMLPGSLHMVNRTVGDDLQVMSDAYQESDVAGAIEVMINVVERDAPRPIADAAKYAALRWASGDRVRVRVYNGEIVAALLENDDNFDATSLYDMTVKGLSQIGERVAQTRLEHVNTDLFGAVMRSKHVDKIIEIDISSSGPSADANDQWRLGFWLEFARRITVHEADPENARLDKSPIRNPFGSGKFDRFEVRSSIGLEGVKDSRAAADKLADEIRRKGAKNVTVTKVLAQVVAPSRPAGAPPAIHTPRGVPPGVPNAARRNPRPAPYVDAMIEGRTAEAAKIADELGIVPEVEAAMARTIWANAFAEMLDSLLEGEQSFASIDFDEALRRLGLSSLAGVDFYDIAPPTPQWAVDAADVMYEGFEKVNGCTMGELLQRAEAADQHAYRSAARPSSRLENIVGDWEFGREAVAEDFGSSIAMQDMGHGVSWFDDHAKFDLKFPRISVDSFNDFDLHLPPPPKKTSKKKGR